VRVARYPQIATRQAVCELSERANKHFIRSLQFFFHSENQGTYWLELLPKAPFLIQSANLIDLLGPSKPEGSFNEKIFRTKEAVRLIK